MSVDFLVLLIRVVTETFVWVVIANSLLSFFLSPYHPVREALERIVGPFLNPIRNLMGSAGGLDFSPLVLILALEFLQRILISLLLSI
ncbi:MAG: YggT family protein [Anaerolineales bacterium]|nr:YggT family protein [Anaerolineales bacterium]MCB9112913.1 YggT family protein [Anaerolineales bacterium]